MLEDYYFTVWKNLKIFDGKSIKRWWQAIIIWKESTAINEEYI